MSASYFQNRPSKEFDFHRPRRSSTHRLATASTLTLLLWLTVTGQMVRAQAIASDQKPRENLKQLSLEQLGNIEVTAVSKDLQQVQKTPAAVFVITQEDIRRSAAGSIPEALRLAPGVDVARVDADHWSVAIRGFAGQFSKSLLVLIDGRSVYTPLFDGVFWDIQNVMLEDVERIEVIRGPGGTIWGANAVNGVINIITKSAKNTQGALATLGGGNVDQGAGAVRFLTLINDILDLSKIEAGRLQLTLENVLVPTSFAEVVDTMRALADKKSQTLLLQAPAGLSVRADPTRFKQVLMNLIGNAIKFTPQGGEIRLSARRVDEVVRVEVRDTGPGIPVEEQQHIFEAFYRLGETDKKTEGPGLGLAITRRLVELHGGNLSLESQTGSGSCFYFTLPGAEILEILEVQASRRGNRTPEFARILVIEDDRAAAHLLQSHLTSAGYDVVLCDQPGRALEMAAELRPSAVTMDIIMKPVNGWQLLSNFKTDPRTAGIPVVLVTIVDQPAMGASLGADEYIVKPVQEATLLAAVERCLSHRKPIGRTRPILVVEDDAPTREFVAELLSKRGYVVTTAADGAEARSRVAASLPELVILDLILPEISGFQLLAEWRTNSRTADLPVFVLTSKDLTPDEQDYIRTHTALLLQKQQPWQETLIAQLRRTLPVALLEKS